MGVIQRQATMTSLISWAGVFLGIFNVLFVVPHVMEAYGLYTFIISIVMMGMPVISLGMQLGVVRFFSEYDDGTKSNRSMLAIGLLVSMVGFLIFCIIAFLFKDQLISYYSAKEPEKYKYLIMVFPLLLISTIFYLIAQYITNFKKIVVPNILRTLIKIVLPILLILYWKEYIDQWGFLYILLIYNVIITLILGIYLKRLGEFDFRISKSYLSKSRWKEMGSYMGNGVLLSLGGVIAGLIDTVMVGSMIDIGRTTAIYSIGTVISGIMIMPNNAVASIASPIISDFWAKKDLPSMQSLYQKASNNLFIIGLLLFAGVWGSIDDVFDIMKDGDVISQAKYVIFFLGLSRLVSMACGINGMVLYLSPKYKVGTYSVLLLAALNVVNNYVFITNYGMVGAAIGTALSIALYNLFISGYLYYQYRLQSFQWSMLSAFVIAFVISFGIQYVDFGNSFINIIVKSAIIGILFVGSIYTLKLSKEINDFILKMTKKFGISLPW